MTPWVRNGDTVMTTGQANMMLPAYGAYTVSPGYPEVFLSDEQARQAAVDGYFAASTSRVDCVEILRRYHVTWVLQGPDDGGLPLSDPALRQVTTGPGNQVLYRVLS
jgi:hypothetical protein